MGEKLARSTHSPDSSVWKVIHYLDSAKQASDDRIMEYTGLDRGQLALAMRKLKRNRVVSEIGGQEEVA